MGVGDVNTLFADELEDRLEKIDIQAQVGVNVLQQGVLFTAFHPVIADDMTHHGPILLLDMRLIILLVGARACEGDLLIQTIVIEQIVDEFTAII